MMASNFFDSLSNQEKIHELEQALAWVEQKIYGIIIKLGIDESTFNPDTWELTGFDPNTEEIYLGDKLSKLLELKGQITSKMNLL